MDSPAPKVPAHVQPYVDVLGVSGAVSFLLQFGGSEVYLSDRPQARSMLTQSIGRTNVQELAKRFGADHVRVPVAKPFIAQHLNARNMAVAEIARTLHVTDNTVRTYLNPPSEKRQFDLFG